MKKGDVVILKGRTIKIIHRDNKFIAFCTYKNAAEKFFSVRKYAKIFSPNGEKKKKVSRRFLLEDGDLIVEISYKFSSEKELEGDRPNLDYNNKDWLGFGSISHCRSNLALIGATMSKWSSSRPELLDTFFKGLYQIYEGFNAPSPDSPPELIYPENMDPFLKSIINKAL